MPGAPPPLKPRDPRTTQGILFKTHSLRLCPHPLLGSAQLGRSGRDTEHGGLTLWGPEGPPKSRMTDGLDTCQCAGATCSMDEVLAAHAAQTRRHSPSKARAASCSPSPSPILNGPPHSRTGRGGLSFLRGSRQEGAQKPGPAASAILKHSGGAACLQPLRPTRRKRPEK